MRYGHIVPNKSTILNIFQTISINLQKMTPGLQSTKEEWFSIGAKYL